MMKPSKAAIEARKARFRPGIRVELVKMNDPCTTLKPGDRGTVDMVDDTGSVFINWDSGSTLAAVYGEDEIKIITTVLPNAVRHEILKLRTLPDCPNMFDTHAVQRLAFDHGMYALVDFIETDRKAYSRFILTGETEGEDA